ncbi:MAG: choice-of-anchor U domain-containing protein, partial [Luminiphilus sp.]
GDAVWEASLEAPNYVLAGDTLTYEITLENTGNRDGEIELTLSWDTGDVVPETTAGNCRGTPMTCSWSALVRAGGVFEPTLIVTAPEGTPTGAIVAALSVIENGATKDSAFASTEVDAQPDLNVTLRSLPAEMVGLTKNLAVEVIVQNKGTAAASEVNVLVPTSIATFASSSSNGSASGDDVVWPQIETLLPNQSSVVLTAQLTAPGAAGAIRTEASVTGKSPGGVELNWESELITVQVADQAAPQLTARFVPATFAPGEEISLVFDYENFGSVAMSDATLSIPIPKDTAVASAPTGGSCTETVCTVSTGEVAAGAKGSQSVTLTVSESVRPERLAGSGLLRAAVVGEFQPQAATAEAEQQDTKAVEPPYDVEITPPAGSGCTLASIGLQPDTGVTGYTLVRDNLLHFSITGCDPEAEVEIPVAITVQGDSFPDGAEAVKTDDNATAAATIAGATVTGNTIRYTLKDNGPLDLDTDPGELRDPVS